MFFIRSFAAMYTYINEAVVTLTAYIDGAIVTLTTTLETAITNLTTYIDGQDTAQATYTDEQIAILKTYVDERETGVVNASQHVYRTGADDADFVLTDLTVDSAYHTLDVSGIVPTGTTLIHFMTRIRADEFDYQQVYLRKLGETYATQRITLCTQNHVNDHFRDVWVACDVDRKIEYLIMDALWERIDIQVLDYIIDAE